MTTTSAPKIKPKWVECLERAENELLARDELAPSRARIWIDLAMMYKG